MRLLTHTSDGSPYVTRNLVDDNEIPPYAILSHTWGSDEEEVTFQDMQSGVHQEKTGYRKIKFCGQQAHKDGYEHFWVDTCCIDKTNHVELSEAITSMYRWYQDARVCYVYLTDVSSSWSDCDASADDHSPRRSWKPSFRKSRWFTRGWTLQELLAPEQVIFYSKEWENLGTKTTLTDLLEEITQIPAAALCGRSLSQFTVAERLSWAKSRQTKRKEDRAYCLLGIFNVYMYLNYGEGDNAFARLTKTINEVGPIVPPLQVVKGVTFDAYGQGQQGCHPATRVDLLQSVQDWTRDTQGKSIFWLNGTAGTGKSTISWTVAKQLSDLGTGPVGLGASFFFKRGEGQRASAALLFPTIASQLAMRIHRFDVSLAQGMKADPQICSKSLNEQFKKLILEPLQQISPQTDPATYVVVIDALDECEHEDDIRVVLNLWSMLPTTTAIRLRLFLTSRPELVIRLGFKKMSTDIHHDLILHEIPQPIIEHDIRVFLTTALDEVRRDYNLMLDDDLVDEQLTEGWPGCHILQELTQMAMPLFIVAATIYRLLRGTHSPQQRLQKILHTGKGASMSEMSKIYTVVLQTMTTSFQDSEDTPHAHRQFQKIVGAIVTLAEPLSRTALAALLHIRSSEVQLCLRLLHAVLEVPANKDSLIRPLHLSFGEYLTSREVQHTPYWIDTKATHTSLWKSCLQLLSSPAGLRENICGLEYPGKLRSGIPLARLEEGLQSELRYACRYWIHHVQHSGQRSQDEDEVHIFLKKHFLHWLEALSLMDQIPEVIGLLGILQSCLSPTTAQLSALVEDARRFVLAHQYIIDLAPLQLYSSAIIFSPQNSLVRRICSQDPNWIRQYLQATLEWGPELQKLEGHCDTVWAVAFSPDGSLLASGSLDTTIRVWEVQTGRKIQKLEGHSGRVTVLSFSTDGSVIASGSEDHTIRIWQIRTGQEIKKLEGHSQGVITVSFSPDSSLLASGSWDRTISVWEVQTGRIVQRLKRHSNTFLAVSYSPNGSLLASGYRDHAVRIWEVQTGQEVQRLEEYFDWAHTASFSPDCSLLAFVTGDYTIQVWEVQTGREVQRFVGHSSVVHTVSFSPDGSLLASASGDYTVRVWQVQTGREVQKLQGHTGIILAVKFSPDGSLIASGSSDSTIRIWEVRKSCVVQENQTVQKDQAGHRLMASSHKVYTMSISPDGSLLALLWGDNTIQVWEIRTERAVQTLNASADFNTSSSRAYSVALDEDATLKLEDATLEPKHPIGAGAISFSSDTSLLASRSYSDSAIRVWKVDTWQEVCQVRDFERRLWNITPSFLYDNSLPTSRPCDQRTLVWDFRTERGLQINDRMFSRINCNSICVWEVQTELSSWRPQDRRCVRNISFAKENTTFIPGRGGSGLDRDTNLTADSVQSSGKECLTMSLSGNWIRRGWSENLLWLPHQYRGKAICHGHSVVVGTTSGLISIFKFRLS